jgi:transposase
MRLVELVYSESLSIGKACKMLSIRPSTAKLIMKKYKEEGTFFEKRSDKLARLSTIPRNSSVALEFPGQPTFLTRN